MAQKAQGSGMASFKQQELKAWQPVLTPVAVIAMLLSVFVVFLPIGIVLEDASNRVVEQSVRYDDYMECANITSTTPSSELPRACEITFTLEHDMAAPIYFYYELRNFYQNHRRYLASKSDAQLRGEGNKVDISDCDPIETFTGKTVVPCGLSPGAFFEDRFNIEVNGLPLCPTESGGACEAFPPGDTTNWNAAWADFYEPGSFDKEGIAWESDVSEKFKYVELSSDEINQGPRQEQSGLNLPRQDDEDFIVWMRTSALPDFRKLHRIISDRDLEKGMTIKVMIYSWFPTQDFGGEKWVTLAKTEWCGGANHALAWTYIVVACVAIALTVTFAILLLFGSRKMADVDRFEWHNRPTNSPMVSIS